MEKISIIIPVYNVEKYIEKCLNSIINQTYTNLEIIIIDDGSKDESMKICKKFANFDSRIILLKQKNFGVAYTRNRAISIATGEYIMFVDPDDYVEDTYVEKMFYASKKYDAAICGYSEKYKNKEIFHPMSEMNLNKNEAIELLYNNYFGGYLWNKIFKRKIIVENEINFDVKIHMCEDLLFVTKYFLCCNNFNVISDILYNYRMRMSSAVWNTNNQKFISLFDAYKKIIEILEEEKISTTNCKYDILNYLYKYKIDVHSLKGLYIDHKKEFIKIMKSKEISLKNKVKLMLNRYFKFIYENYMKNKIKKFKLYE